MTLVRFHAAQESRLGRALTEDERAVISLSFLVSAGNAKKRCREARRALDSYLSLSS